MLDFLHKKFLSAFIEISTLLTMSVKLEPIEKEFQNLENKLEKSNAENYQSILTKIKEELEAIIQENFYLKSEKEKSSLLIIDFKNKLKQFEENLTKVNISNNESEIEKEILKTKLNEAIKANKKQKDDINKEIDSLITENSKLRLEVETKVDKKVQQIYYERQVGKHKDEIKDLNQKFSSRVFDLKKRNYFLNEEISTLKTERTKATNNLIQKSRSINRLTKEISELKLELIKFKETNSKSKIEKGGQTEVLQIKQEFDQFTEEDIFKLKSIKILEEIYDKLKVDYELQLAENVDFKSKYSSQNEQILSLNTINAKLEDKIHDLEKEISNLRNQDSILEQINELNTRLTDKESVNCLLQNEKRIILSKCEAYKQQIKSLEAEIKVQKHHGSKDVQKPKVTFTINNQNWNENNVSFVNKLNLRVF